MAKITVNKESNFTVIDNGIFRDKNLSLKARGLLTTMLSLPEEWDYTVEGLCVILKEGKSSIRSALTELEKYGYLVRKRVRNEKGQLLNNEYFVYEKPQKNKEISAFEPKSENPTLDNPILENRTQLNKKELSTKKENKQLNKLYSRSTELERQESANKELDFEIVKRQIKKEMTSLGYGKDLEMIDCVTEVFEYYYDKYYCYFGEEHTILSKTAMQNTLMRYVEGSDVVVDMQYAPDDYKTMIDKHFTRDYGQEIDYSICHFMTDGIRDRLFYETLY